MWTKNSLTSLFLLFCESCALFDEIVHKIFPLPLQIHILDCVPTDSFIFCSNVSLCSSSTQKNMMYTNFIRTFFYQTQIYISTLNAKTRFIFTPTHLREGNIHTYTMKINIERTCVLVCSLMDLLQTWFLFRFFFFGKFPVQLQQSKLIWYFFLAIILFCTLNGYSVSSTQVFKITIQSMFAQFKSKTHMKKRNMFFV